MRIHVCVKQVPDTTSRIKLNSDRAGIDTRDIQWIISPADELALEEGLRAREKYPDSAVIVFSAGPARAVDAIRMALAMGADEGFHIDLPEQADAFLTAKSLAAAISQGGPPGLVFTGKEAIDDGAAQVGPMIAEFLGAACVSIVQEIQYEAGHVVCRRDVGGGNTEWIQAKLPVLIGCQIGLNQPRYATALNIIKAKKKEVKTLSLNQLGLAGAEQKIRFKDFELPPPKSGCRFIEGDPQIQARELVRILREEVRVL